jgi:RNA polymerase sigma-70 factor (ECF subfamily)
MERADSTALLRAARAGSAEAFDRLYRQVGGKLHALIRLRMGSSLRARVESRDILQATLLRSFDRIDQFEGETGGTLMAWLARIAEHEIRDRVDHERRGRRDVAREIALEPAGAVAVSVERSPLSLAILNEEALRLERAIEGLDPAHRDVILLRKFEELSFREIAARMGRSEDACRMLLARALAALTLEVHRHP